MPRIATVSTSRKPDPFSFQSVRMGIWCRSSVPGRVVARPRYCTRTANQQPVSMARLASNNARRTSVSNSRWSCSQARSQSPGAPLSRRPQGWSACSQIALSGGSSLSESCVFGRPGTNGASIWGRGCSRSIALTLPGRHFLTGDLTHFVFMARQHPAFGNLLFVSIRKMKKSLISLDKTWTTLLL